MYHLSAEKSYEKNRIRRQSVRLVLGSPEDLADALARSEDSNVINTSFVERLNLTIRRMDMFLSLCPDREHVRLATVPMAEPGRLSYARIMPQIEGERRGQAV